MLKPAAGILDGVSLGHLVPGLIYELEPVTANFLIAQGYAEELASGEPALVIPLDNPTIFSQLLGGVSVTTHRAEAADKGRRKRKKR